MADVPLPEPHHQSAANFNAPDEPFYTADQMHAHAAAVSAAKDAEIAQLRADLIKSLAAPVVREPLTKERLQRHALFAADAPPSSAVVLLSSLHRLLGITGGGNG